MDLGNGVGEGRDWENGGRESCGQNVLYEN